VCLTHDQIQFALPCAVFPAEPAVLVAIWMGLFVFGPE
jgi:hypothetical protein